MIPSQHRTWLSSVAFLDVVGFSKRSIHEQLMVKQHMDGVIRQQLNDVSPDDYILLDRGDGAAVCFLVEPEAAFFFAVHVRDALRAQADARPAYDIRVGINLGPIKIIHDVNGDRAPVGEGINCAARVMDFAGANEVLVSRSFYEVIGCQSQEYADLFSYLGRRADKHVREFELYEVVSPGSTPRADKGEPVPAEQEIPEAACVESEAGVTGSDLSPAFVDRVRHSLARAVGPMADILSTRAADRAHSREELLNLLGAALHDPHQRQIFFDGVGVKAPPAAEQSPCATVGEEIEPSVTPRSTSPSLDPELRRAAERALAKRLGPIASMLVERAAAGAAGQAQAFLDGLADRIHDPRQRESFLAEVRGRKYPGSD